MVTCLFIYFCCLWLSTVGTSQLCSFLLSPPPPPPAGLCCSSGSRGSCHSSPAGDKHTGLCLAPGQGCSSSPRTGGRSWPLLLIPAWDTRSTLGAAQRGLSSPPHLYGLGTVACTIPSRSRALLVIAAALEGEPAPAAFPSVCPWAGAGGAVLIPHPQHWPGLESLCQWGEEHPAAPWETKAMFTSDSSGPAGTE